MTHAPLLLLCLLAATAAAVRFTDCSGDGSAGSVALGRLQVEGCHEKQRRCAFPRGHDAALAIPFTPDNEVTSLRAQVTAFIGPLPIPFNLPEPDGCKAPGLSCPLQPGEEVVYRASLPILQQYPPISLSVRWELLDQNDKPVVCIKFPIKVKA